MAKTSAKKISQQNTKTLADLRIWHAGVMVVYFLWRIVFYWSSFSKKHMVAVAAVNGVFFWLYRQLSSAATPTHAADGSLVDAGLDLAGKGLVSYSFDIIYISWGVLMTTAFISDKFWWLYLLIPVFASYKLYTKVGPLLRGFMSSGSQEQPAAGQAAKQKKPKAKVMHAR
ncbi:hypothetical protein BC832DRAFT_545439 [Gaertneriomyces semiglobifer]|nr:hypothetical protein BC832DRAFT_545439 [Gaertneriomyces semiglobifer]